MARTTRRSTAAAVEASRDEDEPEQPTSPISEQEGEEEDEVVNEGDERPASTFKFNQTLLGRPGKQIALTELIKRLSSLGAELSSLAQPEGSEDVLPKFKTVAKELADPQLLAHKDRGVRAWVAVSAVELLRICAPHAPFSQKQLKAVFEMVVKSVFTILPDPSNAYYPQCMDVLKSLVDTMSIVLVGTLPGADALVSQIFTTLFDTLAGSSKASTGEQIQKRIHFLISSLLVIIVDHAESLPQDAVDIMIAQFLRADPRTLSVGEKNVKSASDPAQSTLSMKEYPPAYLAAKHICKTCPDKMTQEISRYFNDVMTDTGNRRDSLDVDDMDTSMVELDETQFAEMSKAHRLLRELWRACPQVLQNVIPQLEHELGVENVQLRVLATETLGDVISGIGAAGPPPPPVIDPAAYPPPDLSSEGNRSDSLLTKPASPVSFSQTHSKAYAAFLSRKQDKSSAVRATWATAIGRILFTNAGGIGLSREEEQRLVEDMARMLNDGEEKVRVAAVTTLANFRLKDVISKLGESGSIDKVGSVLNNLGERIKDKKHAVRAEAMPILASIWAAAIGEIAAGNERVIELVGGIPSKILNCLYTNDQDIVLLMDKTLYGTLLPLNYPPIKAKPVKNINGASQSTNSDSTAKPADTAADPDNIRAERVLLLAKHLDERARTALFMLPKRQQGVSNFMKAYLEYCTKYNGGVMDTNEAMIKDRLARIIAEITKLLPDPVKVTQDLQKFAKLHDRRAYQLMRFCCDAKSDYKTVHNAIKEFLKRVDAPLRETLSALLYRMSILIYNRSHIPTYLDASKSGDKAVLDVTQGILDCVSRFMPSVASTKVNDLYARIISLQPPGSQETSSEVASDLKTCANFAKQMPDKMPRGRDLDEALKAYIQHGSPPEAGKYAVAIGMAQAENRNNTGRVLKEQATNGYKYGKQGFLSRLAALSQLALLSPPTKSGMADFFLEISLDQALHVIPEQPDIATEGYSWSEELDDDALAKCWAIRVATNRIRSWADKESFNKVATPLMKMLVDLVEREGDIGGRGKTSAVGKPRIRLQAAKSLLKLSRLKLFAALFTAQQFQKLAEVALDPVFEVRRAFLRKLQKYSARNVLPARFYTIPFLVAYEPNTAFKSEIVKWLRLRAAFFANQKPEAANGDKKPLRSSTTLEDVVQRLLSFLAHFTDYGDTPAELGESAVYIVFYLSTVASAENISYIYHLVQRVKAMKDAVGAAPGEPNIDFTQRLHILSDLASYTIRTYIDINNWTLQSLPARVTLSTQLFTPIANALDASDIAAKNFLPAEAETLIDNVIYWSRKKSGAGILSLQQALHTKKRKSEGDILDHSAKKIKSNLLPVREKSSAKSKKVSRKKRRGSGSDDDEADDADVLPSTPIDNPNRRKSGRASIAQAKTSYRERDDSEDDAEMEQVDVEAADAGEDENEEDSAAEDMEEDVAEDAAEPDQPSETEEPPPSSPPGRPKRGKQGSAVIASTAISSSPAPKSAGRKAATTKAKGKAKGKETVVSSSPPAPAATGRSTRSRRG